MEVFAQLVRTLLGDDAISERKLEHGASLVILGVLVSAACVVVWPVSWALVGVRAGATRARWHEVHAVPHEGCQMAQANRQCSREWPLGPRDRTEACWSPYVGDAVPVLQVPFTSCVRCCGSRCVGGQARESDGETALWPEVEQPCGPAAARGASLVVSHAWQRFVRDLDMGGVTRQYLPSVRGRCEHPSPLCGRVGHRRHSIVHGRAPIEPDHGAVKAQMRWTDHQCVCAGFVPCMSVCLVICRP